MKVKVDEDRCRGHGMCITFCPEVFEITDDGWAVATPGEVPEGLEGSVRDAIENCPERAISEI
jgi:ferredoxin